MKFNLLFMIGFSMGFAFFSPGAGAEEPGRTVSFALIVGSNRPGGGQKALHFALDDAERFASVLKELGGYPPEQTTVLFDPTGDAVEKALRQTGERVSRERDLGNKTTFVFYYSGHARSTALNLGEAELPLAVVRGLIDAVPSDFKLIVLDACQTGAYSNVKGVTPATDFSHNSVAGLNQEGTAVMASAAASELAQESERLQGSFFTHHLVAALRGAADADSNGRVTLDEAYQYAYDRTLVDTSKTSVGKQHVTLETDLRGKGETVLSRVGSGKARLRVPKGRPLDALIYRASDHRVMAEIHSAAEQGMVLSLPPSVYQVSAQRGEDMRECQLTLVKGETRSLHFDDCAQVRIEKPNTKGTAIHREEHLFFELGLGLQWGRTDAYVKRLHDFGFSSEKENDPLFHLSLTGYYSPIRYLGIGLQYAFLDRGEYAVSAERFSWRAQKIGLVCRGLLPLADDRIALFAEGAAGVAFAKTEYVNDEPSIAMADGVAVRVSDEEWFGGYFLTAGAGMRWHPWPHTGLLWQAAYTFAPVIDNLLSDTHDSGGLTVIMGVMGGF